LWAKRLKSTQSLLDSETERLQQFGRPRVGRFLFFFLNLQEKETDNLALKATRSDQSHMAKDEIRALQEIGPHPNIVHLADSFEIASEMGNHTIVVMEVLKGEVKSCYEILFVVKYLFSKERIWKTPETQGWWKLRS
jgi:hypothetical protein